MEANFNDYIDNVLARIEALIREGRFEDLETDTTEIKPVPPTGGEWRKILESVNAFLNTQGGVVLLGIKEEQADAGRRYVVTGWRPEAEPQVRDIQAKFYDRQGRSLIVPPEYFPPPEIRDFMGQRIAVLPVERLSTELKYAFIKNRDDRLVAYKRLLTSDTLISEREIERQEEIRVEAQTARELEPVADTSLQDIDIGKLNEFIYALNRPKHVETIKPTLEEAVSFLDRKAFIRNGLVTTLGMLVCGKYPGDRLGFRCHVHGYVDVPQEIARDKQDFIDNVLQLMDAGLGYVLRNIHVGVKSEGGGTGVPEYPEDVLRETVNNALAHRDYGVNKQAFIAIKPGSHVQIRNPGRFRSYLLIEHDGEGSDRVRRIIPEPKPRNPRLADVLRAYKKWEGRGIGMSTLVNLCLEDKMGLPTYQLFTEEVALYLHSGKLLDDRMDALFQSFDGYLESRLGALPKREDLLVLAYLIKSEWANQDGRYTILLTQDNNHTLALRRLEAAGLVSRHPVGNHSYPVYIPDKILVHQDYTDVLRQALGPASDQVAALGKDILSVAYRATKYSKAGTISARKVAYDLWYGAQKGEDIKAFDAHYRKVRREILQLADANLLTRSGLESRPEYAVPGVARAWGNRP